MAWIVVFLLIWAPAMIAQTAHKKKPAPAPSATTPAPVATSWPITSISVEGNKAYPSERIVAASGLKVGQPAAKHEFDAARDRLIATGAFSSGTTGVPGTSVGKLSRGTAGMTRSPEGRGACAARAAAI